MKQTYQFLLLNTYSACLTKGCCTEFMFADLEVRFMLLLTADLFFLSFLKALYSCNFELVVLHDLL